MPGPWDASIKLLYPVDQGLFFTIDDIDNNTPYDVIANVEIGENLNEHVDDFVLRVAVRNLTQSTTVAIETCSGPSTPPTTPPSAPRSGSASTPRTRRRVTSSRRWPPTG